MVLALFALLMGTIFYVPYGESAGPNRAVRPRHRRPVRLGGRRPRQPLVTGRPVEFVARSRDVAHGFGVYNPDDVLIFQAQVVPDHDQKIVHTFSQPGVYTVRCLEFCGAGHHLMVSDLRGEEGVMDDRSLAIARKLTVSYIVASTAILAASGLLGVILRWSQAVPAGPRRRQLLVRDDDRARPRRVRRLGRLRGDGPRLLGARRGRLPGARLRPRDGASSPGG